MFDIVLFAERTAVSTAVHTYNQGSFRVLVLGTQFVPLGPQVFAVGACEGQELHEHIFALDSTVPSLFGQESRMPLRVDLESPSLGISRTHENDGGEQHLHVCKTE